MCKILFRISNRLTDHIEAGILTVLFCCNMEDLGTDSSRDGIELVAKTVDGLCTHCVSHNGHLPMSIPERASSRSSPLVQLCHGAPGMLLLLAAAKQNPHVAQHCWMPHWSEALHLCGERVWEQGVLSKGGGLCHGIAGNAWPFLLLHVCFVDDEPRPGKPWMK